MRFAIFSLPLHMPALDTPPINFRQSRHEPAWESVEDQYWFSIPLWRCLNMELPDDSSFFNTHTISGSLFFTSVIVPPVSFLIHFPAPFIGRHSVLTLSNRSLNPWSLGLVGGVFILKLRGSRFIPPPISMMDDWLIPPREL